VFQGGKGKEKKGLGSWDRGIVKKDLAERVATEESFLKKHPTKDDGGLKVTK